MKHDKLILVSEGQTVDALLGSAEKAIKLARKAGYGEDLKWGIKVAQANLVWARDGMGYVDRDELVACSVQRALYHLAHAKTEEDVEMYTREAKAALDLMRGHMLSEMRWNAKMKEELY